jgi:hypothetical protein
LTNSHQEVSKQNQYAVQFNKEADQRPSEENKQNAAGEGSCASEFLWTREECDCLLDADYEGEADEEEDLNR